MKRGVLVGLLLSVVCSLWAGGATSPKREFRGSWIQCVNGQFQGLSPEQMRQRLTGQLDALQACGINAVLFQVRAEGDALYKSTLEPWSRFLTGKQGTAPEPSWDPLAWMVSEAHKRGMELHAWINPYRAKTAGTQELATTHQYIQHPERFFWYGDLLIFNPALQENRDWICKVAEEIVQNYDVDGLHIDDYFYPYPQAGLQIDDEASYRADPRGFDNIGDWRRDNVNRLIEQLHTTLRRVKPWVKFSVSPFGIYHNANGSDVPGSRTGGLQNYDDLYADVLLWIEKGWIDLNIPQIYWQMGHPTADYEELVCWWSENASGRPLIIGQDVERTVQYADVHNPQSNQMPSKLNLQRAKAPAGNCFWYSAALANDVGSYASALRTYYHRSPALQPLLSFIDDSTPRAPKGVKDIYTEDGHILVWLEPKSRSWQDEPYRYVVYRFRKGKKQDLDDPSSILAITSQTYLSLNGYDDSNTYTYVVTTLNRLSAESKGKKRKVKGLPAGRE